MQRFGPFSLTFSLSLSLSNTRTHRHTHKEYHLSSTLSLSFSHTLPFSLSISTDIFFSHIQTLSASLSFKHTLTHRHTHRLRYTQTLQDISTVVVILVLVCPKYLSLLVKNEYFICQSLKGVFRAFSARQFQSVDVICDAVLFAMTFVLFCDVYLN